MPCHDCTHTDSDRTVDQVLAYVQTYPDTYTCASLAAEMGAAPGTIGRVVADLRTRRLIERPRVGQWPDTLRPVAQP